MERSPYINQASLLYHDKLLPGLSICLSRSLLYLAFALVAVAVLWAWRTPIDEVVTAKGKITIQGEPIAMTAYEPGLVCEVPVKVGDRVRKGDLLMQLDTFAYDAERRRVQAQIKTLEVQYGRYDASAGALQQVMTAVEAQLGAVKAEYELLAEQLKRWEKLREVKVASPDEIQRKVQELERVRAESYRLIAERRRAERDVAEHRHMALETTRKIDELRTKGVELTERVLRASIRAPVDGTVTELAVVHPGSVLDTSRPAVILVPGHETFVAKVQVPNTGMRRLTDGLEARVQLDAFPQEDYGYLEGGVEKIEPDAQANGFYNAWLQIRRPEGVESDIMTQLRPGLHLEARIVVGRRSVLNFLLKPLRRLGKPLSVTS
jgi:multidrug resistance efflux pump